MKVALSLSGGLDSAVLLAVLLDDPEVDHVHAVTVNYGQRHQQEVRASMMVAEHYHTDDVTHHLVPLHGLGAFLHGSALTDRAVAVPEGHYEDPSMRLTVVPNRNMVLLSIAAGIAITNGCGALAYAAHAGDHAIYPDCRPDFIDAMALAFRVCHYEPLNLLVPFATKTKADIVKRGVELKVPFEHTWTCYAGDKHPCGKCGACVERAEAFEVHGYRDPLVRHV